MGACRHWVTKDITISPDITVSFPMLGPTISAIKYNGSFMSLLHSVDKKASLALRVANPTLADVSHAEVGVASPPFFLSMHWLNLLLVQLSYCRFPHQEHCRER